MKKTAVVLIKQLPHYRRSSIEGGLTKLGFELSSVAHKPRHGDVLCLWNRCGGEHELATKWEKTGAKVIVFENGYFGKNKDGTQDYAMSLSGHNGSGVTPAPSMERLEKLNLDIRPWRTGKYILVCDQRGIGSPTMASPYGFGEKIANKIRRQITTPVVVRKHPGDKPPATTLEHDLKDAHRCVIWSSSSGIKALIMGVPVIYIAPYWIASDAAMRGTGSLTDLEVLFDDQRRLLGLAKAAASQFSIEEIASGDAINTILSLGD